MIRPIQSSPSDKWSAIEFDGMTYDLKVKTNGCVQIACGHFFEVINLDNCETVGGNAKYHETVREFALEFAHSFN